MTHTQTHTQTQTIGGAVFSETMDAVFSYSMKTFLLTKFQTMGEIFC